MTPEIHKRVRALFEEALEWPEAERASRLQSVCAGEPAVFDAVERLLNAHRSCDSFLQDPARPIQRIGRYVITGELGRGAMGVVYDALDPMIGRKLAVKVIRLQAFTDAAEAQFLRERLFREARSAGVLSHPGIVTVFDVGEEGDLAFIAMERVEGISLDRALASGRRFSREEAIHILRQVAAALDYAHWSGVVHRDVKPANIMIDNWTNVKIADFGIAKIASLQSQTLSGMVIGTPIYMSPEQIEARVSDGRSDQFSLAIVAYELLTGSRPFQADTLAALAHAIVYSVRPSPRAANPELPPAMDSVLHRGLARFPKERYSSCGDFVAAVDEALKASSLPRPDVPALSRKPPLLEGPGRGNESSVRARIVGTAAAAALLAVSLLYILRPAQPPATVKPDEKAASHAIPKSKSRRKSTPDTLRPMTNVPKSPGSQMPPEPLPVPGLSATIPQPSPRPPGDPKDKELSGLISIRDVRPEYSAIANKLHVEGRVALKMVVMRDGRTSNVTVMRSLGYGLDEKAMQAAKQWLYIPRKKDGVPVMATLNVEENFLLKVKAPGTWTSGPMAFKLDKSFTKPVIKDGERPNAITDLANTSVLLEFIVDSNGAVKNIQLINGSESLMPSLANCLGTWRFQPARKGTRAVEALGRVRFIKGTEDQNARKPLFEGQARSIAH
jgi:serine/threonine-protein kinase